MTRSARWSIANGLYHVMNRGLEKRDMVRDDVDRREWLRLWDRVTVVRTPWSGRDAECCLSWFDGRTWRPDESRVVIRVGVIGTLGVRTKGSGLRLWSGPRG